MGRDEIGLSDIDKNRLNKPKNSLYDLTVSSDFIIGRDLEK
jgi:hypothetical protein